MNANLLRAEPRLLLPLALLAPAFLAACHLNASDSALSQPAASCDDVIADLGVTATWVEDATTPTTKFIELEIAAPATRADVGVSIDQSSAVGAVVVALSPAGAAQHVDLAPLDNASTVTVTFQIGCQTNGVAASTKELVNLTVTADRTTGAPVAFTLAPAGG